MHLWSDTLASNPWLFEITLFVISILAGVVGAILGLGGGVIIVPALTLLYGINIRYAVGASIVAVIATSSAAAAAYVRDHVTNIRVAMLLEVATTLGALGGAVLSAHFPGNFIFFIFALVLFYSAAMMFRSRHSHAVTQGDKWAAFFKLNASYPDPVLNREVEYSVTHVPLGFILMIGAGLLSGLLGIGSGALKVPAMDTAMGLPIKVSSATSSFMIGVTGAASAGTYYSKSDILPELAGPVAVGVLFGSWLGTMIMMKLHNQKIRKMFIVILLVIAIQMVLRTFGIQVR